MNKEVENILDQRRKLIVLEYAKGIGNAAEACRDLDVDCDFSVTGEKPEKVKDAVFSHGNVVHKEMLEAMTPDELADLEKAVEGAIKPA